MRRALTGITLHSISARCVTISTIDQRAGLRRVRAYCASTGETTRLNTVGVERRVASISSLLLPTVASSIREDPIRNQQTLFTRRPLALAVVNSHQTGVAFSALF